MVRSHNVLTVATTVVVVGATFQLGVPPIQAVLTGSIGGAFVAVCGRPEIRRRTFGGVDADTGVRSGGAFVVVLVSLAGLTTTSAVPFHVAIAGVLAVFTAFGVGVRTEQPVDGGD